MAFPLTCTGKLEQYKLNFPHPNGPKRRIKSLLSDVPCAQIPESNKHMEKTTGVEDMVVLKQWSSMGERPCMQVLVNTVGCWRNFQGIRYTMEQSEDSRHQVEKISHNSNITNHCKSDEKTRRKLVRSGRLLRGLQQH